jgi:hypothetical protein
MYVFSWFSVRLQLIQHRAHVPLHPLLIQFTQSSSISHSFFHSFYIFTMKPSTPLRLQALRQATLSSRLSLPASARWQHSRAMSTVVDYHPRASQPPPPPPAGANDAVEKQRAEKRKQILREAVSSTQVRHDWTKDEIAAIYYQPVLELAYQAVSNSSCMLAF